MVKKEWYEVSISGNRGSTIIAHILPILAESKGDASAEAKKKYGRMHPDAKNVTIKNNRKK